MLLRAAEHGRLHDAVAAGLLDDGKRLVRETPVGLGLVARGLQRRHDRARARHKIIPLADTRPAIRHHRSLKPVPTVG